MDRSSVLGLVIFQLLCTQHLAFPPDDRKRQLADTLDRLLKCPGWARITSARAKHRNAAGEIESFGADDLLFNEFDLDLNEEYSENRRIVDANNVYGKYEMTVHLLGCVYAQAVLTFLHLLHTAIVMECKMAKKRSIDKAGKKITRRCVRHEAHLTAEERALALDSSACVDYKSVYDVAVEQLENHRSMLDFMCTALRYLMALAPRSANIIQNQSMMQGLRRITSQMDEIKNLPTDVGSSTRVPSDDNDEKYKEKIKIVSDKVSGSIDVGKQEPLVEFKIDHCILLSDDKQHIDKFHKKYRRDVVVEEMNRLENEVCTSFYTHLGFAFDSVNQATVLAPDDNRNNIDNTITERGNIDNVITERGNNNAVP